MTDPMDTERGGDPLDLEAEGMPAVQDRPAGVEEAADGLIPPRDYPQAVDDRVTAAEQVGDETLAERGWREEPDVEPGDEAAVGRLVQPDQGMADLDDEATETAQALGSDADALSAEEAAVHITDTP